MPKSGSILFHSLVICQVGLCCAIVLSGQSPFRSPVRVIPLSIAVLAVSLGIWALVTMGKKTMNVSPALRESASLKTRGPYRWVRHPMYSALLLFCGCYVFVGANTLRVVGWVLLLLVLIAKARCEEKLLRARFPEYIDYASRVKRLIPFVF